MNQLSDVRATLKNLWPRARSMQVAILVVGGVLLMVLALVALISPVQPTPSATPAIGQARDTGGLPLGLDIGAKLIAVLALIYASGALARKYLVRGPVAPRGAVHVLDSTALAAKKTIYLIEVGGRVLVVGGTDATLTTLTEFNDPDEVASLIGQTKPTSGFQRYLDFSMGNRLSNENPAADARPLPFVARTLGRFNANPGEVTR